MPNYIEGSHQIGNLRLGIVASRWNEIIVERLLEGTLECIAHHGGDAEGVDVVRCPGAYEIPAILRRMARSGRYDVLVALGCVIRGATPHFEYVAGEAARGIAGVMADTGIPCGFGVLTVDTIEQAMERAAEGPANKGWEATTAAVEVANALIELEAQGRGRGRKGFGLV